MSWDELLRVCGRGYAHREPAPVAQAKPKQPRPERTAVAKPRVTLTVRVLAACQTPVTGDELRARFGRVKKALSALLSGGHIVNLNPGRYQRARYVASSQAHLYPQPEPAPKAAAPSPALATAAVAGESMKRGDKRRAVLDACAWPRTAAELEAALGRWAVKSLDGLVQSKQVVNLRRGSRFGCFVDRRYVHLYQDTKSTNAAATAAQPQQGK